MDIATPFYYIILGFVTFACLCNRKDANGRFRVTLMYAHIQRILILVDVDELALMESYILAQIFFHQLGMLQLEGFLFLSKLLRF